MASMLVVLQGANWQRGGGKGEKPKRLQRPKEHPKLAAQLTPDDLAARKQKLRQERERRAARK